MLAARSMTGLLRADVEREDAILEGLARGDERALGRVYEHHYGHVLTFARRLVGDAAAAEDLVHDVFVALPAAIRRFHGDCSLRTFLLSIAVNHARRHVRTAARRRAAQARLLVEHKPESPRPDADVEREQLASALATALDALPLDQRVAFVLCEVEEKTGAEAAAIVGANEATLRSRVFHAKRKLRDILQSMGVR
ncbi:RNA polymerase sigma factor RpoE [Minicystis rosea]|nr:RNA polymerase sigma factor RpoE [Minicystis rosea]